MKFIQKHVLSINKIIQCINTDKITSCLTFPRSWAPQTKINHFEFQTDSGSVDVRLGPSSQGRGVKNNSDVPKKKLFLTETISVFSGFFVSLLWNSVPKFGWFIWWKQSICTIYIYISGIYYLHYFIVHKSTFKLLMHNFFFNNKSLIILF